MMPRALVMLRAMPCYRRDSFVIGLREAGYDVFVDEGGTAFNPKPGDCVVTWNRYGRWQAAALKFEAAGANVIVAENGYIGNDADGRQLYAIARTAHCGMGQWFVGDEDRWSARNIAFKPWRADPDGHALICPQRGFTAAPYGMPSGWASRVLGELRKAGIPARVREHPKAKDRHISDADCLDGLMRDLDGARAAVIWGSSAGVHALIAGYPVFHDAPRWVADLAARKFSVTALTDPFLGDRLPAFHRLAWAQWTVDEISTGVPFRHLLQTKVQAAA